MQERLTKEQVSALRMELSGLPKGSVTTKTIKGIKRFYLKWLESGKTFTASDGVVWRNVEHYLESL